MQNAILSERMTEMDCENFLKKLHETYQIELKKAQNLPSAFWETYSSFSNTEGGWIILGVAEGSPDNEIVGVGNADKIVEELWNQISNPNKVNFRNIDNDDVHIYSIGEKEVIIINIKEAPEKMKPVYTGGKIENTYIRTGDGDRRATIDEIKAFMRNAQPCEDSLFAERFTIDDLDLDSVLSFRGKVHNKYPNKDYKDMEISEFLKEVGAAARDRITGEFKIYRGTILFLGKCNSIKELYPHYHVDFFNHSGNNSRWSDRVTDDEPGEYEMNLYNFYRIVYEKIKLVMQEPFLLDQQQIRLTSSDFEETIRECLVNCLAHADYVQGYPSTKVDLYEGWISFLNPGKMLVTKQQFATGGTSHPRNETVMKLFRLLGLSERQGFGGRAIYKTAVQYNLRAPEVTTDLEHTEIKIWMIDITDSYPELTEEEKAVFRCIVKKQAETVNTIQDTLQITNYKTRNAIHSLEEKELIEKVGKGPATKYVVSMKSPEFITQLQMAFDFIKQHLGQTE